jgi:hypothetical protein
MNIGTRVRNFDSCGTVIGTEGSVDGMPTLIRVMLDTTLLDEYTLIEEYTLRIPTREYHLRGRAPFGDYTRLRVGE